jgi:hypothetical protein
MQVNITKRIDTPEGKLYCLVIISPNGRIKPDWVMVNDRQERHPEGTYYLDWNEAVKRRRMAYVPSLLRHLAERRMEKMSKPFRSFRDTPTARVRSMFYTHAVKPFPPRSD